MLYFDTLQIGRPFLHTAGSHDSCCNNLNQKSMICANIFNWQSIALGKKLKNCALWIFFYEFIIRNYPSLHFSFCATQVWIVFLFKWPFQILAHCTVCNPPVIMYLMRILSFSILERVLLSFFVWWKLYLSTACIQRLLPISIPACKNGNAILSFLQRCIKYIIMMGFCR